MLNLYSEALALASIKLELISHSVAANQKYRIVILCMYMGKQDLIRCHPSPVVLCPWPGD